MNPGNWPGGLAYVVVFLAALLEGEVVLVAASALVGAGALNPFGVWLAGALGGSAGDQLFFYALRGRLRRWLERFPPVLKHQRAIVRRVRAHSTLMVLGCRFLPGLRMAIPVACAYAGVSPVRFTTLNLLGALAWAGAVLTCVAWGGPKTMAWIGLEGWWALVIPGTAMVLFFRWLGKASTALEDEDQTPA